MASSPLSLGLAARARSPEERDLGRHVRLVAICLAAVVVAYHYSLRTLFSTLGVETPLAYLGLVPAISLVLVLRRSRHAVVEPPIHDRQVDYIVGLTLLIVSVAIGTFLPVRLDSMFWIWRVDLLGLPLFAAGAITLLFGVRTLWRYKVPLLFLFLAWPLPYTVLLLRQMEAFTAVTLVGVKGVLHVLPVAHPIDSANASLFQVGHGARGFQVSVASACSGVNGVIGYALVGLAFLTEVKGRVWAKVLWLASGLVLIWVLNVVRIVLIFAVGARWGEGVAIDALHPVLGLITFNIGVLAMLLAMGLFGLQLRTPVAAAPDDPTGAMPTGPRVRHSTRLAVAIVVTVGLVSGLANAGLRSFDLVANMDGSPRLAAFLDRPGRPLGWRAHKVAQYTWARQFFGSDSDWYRYDYTWDWQTPSPFDTRAHVVVDVIQTAEARTLSTYGVEACYQFHGYGLSSVRSVDLGGVLARVVSYKNTSVHANWTSVYWNWPVQTPQGTRYERVTIMLNTDATTHLAAKAPEPDAARTLTLKVQNRLSGHHVAAVDDQMAQTQAFLVAFAADLVKRQPAAPKEGP